jgi:hypothetical protein
MEKSNIKVDYSKNIGNAVFNINAKYTELQNKTKILYFTYLQKDKPVEDFTKQVNKLWGNIDHEFMDKQIAKLQELIHSDNVRLAIDIKRINGVDYYKIGSQEWKINDEYFKLVPESEFNKYEKKFMDRVIKDYSKKKKMLESKEEIEKDIYLENQLNKYDERINQVVAYYNKDGGIQRYTQLSSYLSMLHNVDLTRSGWNQTLADAEYLGAETFIIPYHPFSCEYCQIYQNKPLSKEYVTQVLGIEAEEQIGDILHPNCKCTLSILWDISQIDKITPDYMQEQENYKIRQKVNGISLSRTKLEVDLELARKLGNEGMVDKIEKRLWKLSYQEQKLINKLQNETLKKQVVAINR